MAGQDLAETTPQAPGDPAVAAAPTRGWLAWARHLTRREPERLASFGGAIAVGFALSVLLMYAFAWLASEVLEQETTALDQWAFQAIHAYASPRMDVIAPLISFMGAEAVVVIGSVLVVVFLFQRRWGAAGMLILVTLGAQLLNTLLKAAFQRTRPEPVVAFLGAQQYSFPSGHAMVSTAFYGYLAYLSWRLLPRPWWMVMVAGFTLLVLAVGISRIYLEAHFVSDVIAGYLAGLLWLDACILSTRLLVLRHPRPARRARTVKA